VKIDAAAIKTQTEDFNLVGWSPHIANPIFRQGASAYNRRMIIMGIAAFVIYPFALGTYGYFDTAEGENFWALLCVGFALGLFSLIWCVRPVLRRMKAPTWDGMVEEKNVLKKRRKKYTKRKMFFGSRYEWQNYTVYQVVIRKDDKGVMTLDYENSSYHYDNYTVGDRVRFHGFMEYVEKYDKRGCKFIICAYCKNDCKPQLNLCDHCGTPLLKGAMAQ
jgi:hypothetical protein